MGKYNRCNLNTSLLVYVVKVGNIWLLLLLATPYITGAQPYLIYDSIAIIHDPHPFGVNEKINIYTGKFYKAPDNRVNFGLAGSDYKYIALKLQADSSYAGQYLSIDNTSVDTVSIYRLYDDGGRQLIYQGGSRVTFDGKRNYVWHTAKVAISDMPSFYLIALKAPQENINVQYEILDSDALQRKYQAYEKLVFFYLGVVCMIAATILTAFLLFKRAVFAAYLGYIFCVSGWILSHYGRVFPFLYPNVPVINEIAKPLSSLGVCIFLIVVLQMVFKVQLQSGRWLQQLLTWAQYFLLSLTALMFLLLSSRLNGQVRLGLVVCWHVALVISAPIIVFASLYYIKSGFIARVFAVAILIVCIMALVQLFGNLGFISNYFINEHGMALASLFEMSLMAYGLFYSLLIERKQKEKQVLALQNEQTETLKKLITVQDNERKRIAADLHDNIGPLLAALKINFRRIVNAKEENMQKGLVAKTESIIDDSIAEIRNVAHNLMPKGLSSNGLINTLNEYFEGLQQLYGKTIVFHHEVESILNPELQINVYRIICELVLNATRHSNARLITIRMIADLRLLAITINDDGQGFMPRPGEDKKKSLGLQNAESRVLYMKGSFSLNTNPGEGTAINMQIPLQFEQAKVNRL